LAFFALYSAILFGALDGFVPRSAALAGWALTLAPGSDNGHTATAASAAPASPLPPAAQPQRLLQRVFECMHADVGIDSEAAGVVLLAAIGVILILKQLPHLVGHDTDYEGEMAFLQADGRNTFSEIAQAVRAFLPGAALVGLSCIAMLFVWEKSRLKKSLFPAPLAAVLLGVAISELLRVSGSSWIIEESHLVEVPILGVNGQGWGTIFSMPDWSQWNNPKIYTAAITLAIVASLETLLNLEATDKLDPQKRVSPPNRELFAQGVGNVAAGMIGGMPMTSVISPLSLLSKMSKSANPSIIWIDSDLPKCLFR
jgi:hypothetical protein